MPPTMFVIAPVHAMGIFVFQGFAIVALLGIIGGMLVISDHPVSLAVMSVCFAANVVVFLERLLFPPWPYNVYLLAAAWLAIAVTLGAVVAQAVFRSGRVTYHRIVGAILLYLLIALAFGTLFMFVGLTLPDAFKGITFADNSGPCQLGLLFEFGHPDIDRVRRPCSGASDCAKPMQYRKHHWSAVSSNVIGEACDPRTRSEQPLRMNSRSVQF
jgi:hypothetical protein